MKSKRTWIWLRLALVIANTFGLQLIFQEKTNLDLLAGLAGGVVFFMVLKFWLGRRSHMEGGSFASFDAPFLPMAHHPRAYWFTMGLSLFIGAIFGFASHMAEPGAAHFFGALAIVGISILLAVISPAAKPKR